MKMTRLYLDLETYCEVPIRNGVHAYAESAEIMLFAYALDNGPVKVWDRTEDKRIPDDLEDALNDTGVLLYAHNSHFDRTVLWHNGCKPLIARWRDTMAMALAHSLPGSLGALCDVLKVPVDKAKDKAGRYLVNLFCKPRPATSKVRRATRETHPAEWESFKGYAALDIKAMREVAKRLPVSNYQGAELALWHLDQEINDRGVLVDTELAHAAIRAVERAQKELAARTSDLTMGMVQAATQRDALLRHITAAYGIDLPDMQRSTLERCIAYPDLPAALRELLAIRLQASTTSTAKYRTLVRGVSGDDRLRGTLQFCGASRTGRWSGRMFQPQNLPRPTLKQSEIDHGIAALKADCADLLVDDVMGLTSNVIRGCIVAPVGKKLVVADLSNIEGRALAWLAGEVWKLLAFSDFDTCKGLDGAWHTGDALIRATLAGNPIAMELDGKGEPTRKGSDLYKLAYAKSFGIPPADVTKDQRQIGKVQELMFGYGGGVGAYITGGAAYNIDLEAMGERALPTIPPSVLKEAGTALAWARSNNRPKYGLSDRAWLVCDSFKRLWRCANPSIVVFWRDLESAAVRAVSWPGETLECRMLKLRRDGAWLRIRLPSGRYLCYPGPQVDDAGKLSYMGINQYSRKWSRISTYGGKLAENVTQAVSRDVLAASMPAIDAAGYQIVLSVHDELITEADDSSGFSAAHLAGMMATNPDWANGLPLAAAGFEAYRYRKD